MTAKTKERLRKRFHQLAVKEALGTATAADSLKLEKIQGLLRYQEPASVLRSRIRQEWKLRGQMKFLTRELRRIAGARA